MTRAATCRAAAVTYGPPSCASASRRILSTRFSAKKSREDVLAEFFQKELDDAPVGSEKETKLLEFIQNFMEQERSELVQEESVEEIKKRVNAMLKEIEDRKEQHA